jgi:hypothetical protein
VRHCGSLWRPFIVIDFKLVHSLSLDPGIFRINFPISRRMGNRFATAPLECVSALQPFHRREGEIEGQKIHAGKVFALRRIR